MDDRTSDQTSTCRLGVRVTPRRPGFDFEGLEHELPRAWHPAGIGPTAFLEALSAMAPVVEGFFIDDARRLLPRIAAEAPRAEVEAFLRQEAAHAGMHAAFNRLLIRWGVPVDASADSVLRWLAVVDWTWSDLRSAVGVARGRRPPSARRPPVAVPGQPALPLGAPRHDRRSCMGGQSALSRHAVGGARRGRPRAPRVMIRAGRSATHPVDNSSGRK